MSGPQTSGPAYQVVNPATGQVVESFDYTTDKEVESAIAAVHAAYTRGPVTDPTGLVPVLIADGAQH